jgi:hypothetical protein
MSSQNVTCTYDGDTFVGRYGVSGQGEAAEIKVTYRGRALATRVGDLRPEFLARTLLGELVREQILGAIKHDGRASAPRN